MPIATMSDVEFAAYLAGFTDGEGYIGVERHGRRNRSGLVRITVANTHGPIISAIRERLGFGYVRSQKQDNRWKLKWTYNVTSLSDCERFLMIVFPYLVVKRAAADRAFERIREAQAMHRKKRDRNAAVIAAAMSGKMRKIVAMEFGISPQMVSRICCGHRWPSERRRIAKHRKRDARGLFVRIP